SASLAKLFCERVSVRRRIRSASRRSAATAPTAASAASARERASARSFSASTLSSRATIWPASTTLPSSANTSTTLPVISAAIVALRRATTYPEATKLVARRGSIATGGEAGACCACADATSSLWPSNLIHGNANQATPAPASTRRAAAIASDQDPLDRAASSCVLRIVRARSNFALSSLMGRPDAKNSLAPGSATELKQNRDSADTSFIERRSPNFLREVGLHPLALIGRGRRLGWIVGPAPLL